ncbi:hydrogen gas-evolving membrane-bound hydrogenase subunit E [Streptomyces sp. NPDC057438]|uniref:hydrogen gas-evolving membrane-bound hydrogenase subunit E n=1 Tax=Streptomyces sp. NPDC057438 TaxID=3346133 RepID=UPI0036A3EE74
MTIHAAALTATLASMGALAAAAPVLERRLGRDAGYVLAAGFVALAVLLGLAARAPLAGDPVTVSWQWMPSLQVVFTLRLDGLSWLFCILVLAVGALILAYSARYLPEEGRHGRLYTLLTAFGTAMLGLVLAGDLVLLFVFWELTTILSFLLIGTTGPHAARPALRALLVTALGGLALLVAVVLLAVTVGTTDLATVLAAREEILESPVAPAVGALLILAAATKSAQFPFHFWLPGAMVAITPVSAYLHAATMVKAGIYLLLRFSALYAGQPGWSLTLTMVGLVTAVLGAVQALREHDLKALLAYSTVSQLGLLTAAIGVGTTVALAAAVLHTFAHALFKATLFMLVGIIDKQAGSRDIRKLSGLRRVMPVTATLTGLASLSLAGVAPLIGFVSKESLFQGFAGADMFPGASLVAGTLAVTASALTFAYATRIFYDAFAGPTTQRRLYEPAWSFLAPAAVAAAAGLILGPAVTVLNPLMSRAVLEAEPWGVPPYFSFWHGMSLELGMSAVTMVLGLALFVLRARTEVLLGRLPHLGGTASFDRTYSGVLRLGKLVGRPDLQATPGPFLVRPVLAVIALGVAGAVLLGVPAAAPTDRAADGPLEWGVLLLLAAVVAGLITADSSVATVAFLGATGLIVTVWFLLAGAPDVALTLLLVEVLTAVAAAFVLRDLRPYARRPDRRRGTPAAWCAAVLAGCAATGGTLALIGHRELSPAGDYFLNNAKPQTGGSNVVNTILVDFRGLDTLGESVVLAAVALGLVLLLPRAPGSTGARDLSPAAYATVLGPAYRVLAPAMALLSAYLFLRGHNEPGGGFIAALTAGIAVALAQLSGVALPRWVRSGPLVAVGLLLALTAGLAATLTGRPFLTPLKPLGDGPGTALLFDAGVYVVVLGLMAGFVDRLTSPRSEAC